MMFSERAFRLLLGVLTVWSAGQLAGLGRVRAQRDSRFALEPDDSGGYVNFLVGIGERVPEDPAILEGLVHQMTEASMFLFQATKKQVYFREVHVLIPESWSDSENYQDAEWQRHDHSDLIVDIPSENQGNVPYTRQMEGCGLGAAFIHMTPDYIRSDSLAERFGPRGKVFAHEWGHYRWGVFDEYPTDGSHFYSDRYGNYEAVRCVKSIPGTWVTRSGGRCEVGPNGYPDDCRFRDNTEATGYTGSLMYKQFLPEVSTYCEKESNGVSEENTHNRDAPNKQNDLCSGKSVWEVMLEHRDFSDLRGENDVRSPRSEAQLVPTFKYFKKRPDRLVLVLDVSGSMKGYRLTQLRQACEQLITQTLEDGVQQGVVQFEETATILSHLLEINAGSRQTLLNVIPMSASGATSIGAGVLAGIRVLEGGDGDGTPAGGKLLVITDGLENRAPWIADVIPMLNGSGILVDTFAIGASATPNLEQLATVTGGRAYYHGDESNTLADAFGKSASGDKDAAMLPVTLYSNFTRITPGHTFSGAAHLDGSVGLGTQFLFSHSGGQQVEARVQRPGGDVIAAGSPGYAVNNDFSQIRISVAGVAEMGSWTFDITNNETSTVEVTVLVQSRARGKDPIAIKSEWGLPSVAPPQKQSLYVTVGKGYVPVVGGEVTATVDLPCGGDNRTTTLQPKDDGTGSDIIKDDGVYSAYFTEFCGEGRYGVSVVAKNKGKETAVDSGRIIGVGAAVDVWSTDDDQPEPEVVSTGDFRRVTIGESFRCEGSDLCNGSVDLYPPSRIRDLVASPVHMETKQVNLTFTAPGDDLTTGQASRYRIVMSRKSADIFEDFEAVPEIPSDSFVRGNVTRPSRSGQTEVFEVRVPEIGPFSYSFAVLAEDEAGNRGEPSNLATSSARNFTRIPVDPFPGGWVVAGVAAAAAAVVFVMVIACVVGVHQRRRSRRAAKGGQAESGRQRADPDPVSLSISGDMACKENGGASNEYHGMPFRNTAEVPAAIKPKPADKATKGGPPKKAMKPPVKRPASSGSQPPAFGKVNAGFDAEAGLGRSVGPEPVSSPLYSDFITRRHTDPNWDPSMANNREGGGANIKTGHVAGARAKIEQSGLLK